MDGKKQRHHPQKRFSITIVLSLLFFPSTVALAKEENTIYDLAIVNATVVSPERQSPLKNATILIRDGLIVDIVHDNHVFKAEATIDGEGGFLIPGLIDSHVHLYHATGLKQRYTDQFETLYAAYMTQMPRSFLYHGFTTVIETNADREANQQFTKSAQHPDLKHCGAGLILSDGYMASELPKGKLMTYAPNFLHDRFNNGYLPEAAVAAEHTSKATVAKIAESGAVCIKLFYEEALWMPGGAPNLALPSEEIIREVVSEARSLGLSVVMHATSPKGHKFARNTGVDIIAHGPWDWKGNDYSNSEIPSQIQQTIVATGLDKIAVQPTISALQHTASLFKPEFLADSALEKVLPAAFIDYLRTDAQIQIGIFIDIFGAAITTDPTPEKIAPAMSTMIGRYKRMTGLMAKSGTNLLLGSDTSSGGFGWGNPPGLNGFWEMKDWAESGVALDVIFAASTINNARAFGLENEIGTVEIGKRANLLLLKTNPLQEIEAYNKIQTVILRGNPIGRDTLSAENLPSPAI